MMNEQHKKVMFDLRKMEASVPKMVAEMGAIAHTHFTMSFNNQGFTDEHLEKWKPRKRQAYRTRGGKLVDDTTRGILIGKGTGNLRKLRRVPIGRYSVEIRSNAATKDYARVHNEGLRSVRGNGFTMPKRQFAGYSGVMDRKIRKMVFVNFKKAFYSEQNRPV